MVPWAYKGGMDIASTSSARMGRVIEHLLTAAMTPDNNSVILNLTELRSKQQKRAGTDGPSEPDEERPNQPCCLICKNRVRSLPACQWRPLGRARCGSLSCWYLRRWQGWRG